MAKTPSNSSPSNEEEESREEDESRVEYNGDEVEEEDNGEEGNGDEEDGDGDDDEEEEEDGDGDGDGDEEEEGEGPNAATSNAPASPKRIASQANHINPNPEKKLKFLHDQDGDGDDDEEEEEDGDGDGDDNEEEEGEGPNAATSNAPASPKRIASQANHINPNPEKKLKFLHDHDGVGNENKSFQTQILWSLEDELVLLKAMIDLKKNKLDPYSNIDTLLESTKNLLHFDVSTKQLKRKIRALKDKFNKNANRVRKRGKLPHFAKSHDSDLYNLSIKIWGIREDEDGEDVTPDVGNVAFAKTPFPEPEMKKKRQKISTVSHYPYLSESLRSCKKWTGGLGGLGDSVVKEGFGLIPKSQTEELERRCRMQQIKETEIYLSGVLLIRDKTKLILDALKSSLSP
ncbi:hypothetical protein Syun_006709 [Stephania yunnanensis]|uniref:Glabrous enhancer-binding protein-like DBD domain-containing protein n=1 Tax=Stephania yunnanensis TaxID=152371 RepID=A0AAP0KYJ8_9MAGN